MSCDVLFRGATVIDGSGAPGYVADVAVASGRIVAIGPDLDWAAGEPIDGRGRVLAPGFIDVHTHDDLFAIHRPEMRPKITQGVTTVIVGNCGISAAGARLPGRLPDPMNLLGRAEDFRQPSVADYQAAVERARPAANVATLIGHTTLRNNLLDRLDRAATPGEIAAMRADLRAALEQGAIGLSTGLAYASASAAPTDEVLALLGELAEFGGIYTTHLRTEFDGILDAMGEAFSLGRHASIPVVISHHKCAGVKNWGRTTETLAFLESAAASHEISCDCYPYSASSSTLDLKQVTDDYEIFITWSDPHPEIARRTLREIAGAWNVSLADAASRLQPAGAVYHNMDEGDVRRVLRHPLTMIGSDGLPNDPMPHPRLWGAFPRVLGRYSRELKLFPLQEAVHKMTGLSAERFRLADRGRVLPGWWADLVLFDPVRVEDRATFAQPAVPARGIELVMVNGVTTCRNGELTGARAGRFLPSPAAASSADHPGRA